MATIIRKQNPSGKLYYTAQARVTENGVVVYRKAKNFPTKQDAKDWGNQKRSVGESQPTLGSNPN